MKMVASDTDSAKIGLMRSTLEANGIRALLRNQELSQLAGRLPPAQVWLEVWIIDDDDFEAAKRLIQEVFGS